MARIIEQEITETCQDCPFRVDGGVVEDICNETDQHIYDDYDDAGNPQVP